MQGKVVQVENFQVSTCQVYYIPRSVTSFLFVLLAVMRIFPSPVENLQARTAAVSKIPFSLKKLLAGSIFSEPLSTSSWHVFS